MVLLTSIDEARASREAGEGMMKAGHVIKRNNSLFDAPRLDVFDSSKVLQKATSPLRHRVTEIGRIQNSSEMPMLTLSVLMFLCVSVATLGFSSAC
jgi:hypothetical protein